MTGVSLEPLDTWFFRGGVPFTAKDTPQENVKSLFPPHPATTVGALRVALALARGWNGRGRWSADLNDVLGNGPEDLGRLSFNGPLLLRCGKPLFPCPRHLLGVGGPEGWQPRALLRPGEPVLCDLGEKIRLPQLPQPQGRGDEALKMKTGDDAWLTLDGMAAVLCGEPPEGKDVVESKNLWRWEERTGLERDRDSRTAKEAMLYSTRHVRPTRGVSLGVQIVGLPEEWADKAFPPFGRMIPLGGESRLAECRKWDDGAKLGESLKKAVGSHRAPETAESARQVVLVALSPLDLEEAVTRGGGQLQVPDLGRVQVVSACLDRPQRIGGWDSLTRRPLPLHSVLAPGSVLFCKLPENSPNAPQPKRGALLHIGSRCEWGYGLVALGAWPEHQEAQP